MVGFFCTKAISLLQNAISNWGDQNVPHENVNAVFMGCTLCAAFKSVLQLCQNWSYLYISSMLYYLLTQTGIFTTMLSGTPHLSMRNMAQSPGFGWKQLVSVSTGYNLRFLTNVQRTVDSLIGRASTWPEVLPVGRAARSTITTTAKLQP